MRGLMIGRRKWQLNSFLAGFIGQGAVGVGEVAEHLHNWDNMAELADACRRAAADKNAGLADVYKVFHDAEKTRQSSGGEGRRTLGPHRPEIHC